MYALVGLTHVHSCVTTTVIQLEDPSMTSKMSLCTQSTLDFQVSTDLFSEVRLLFSKISDKWTNVPRCKIKSAER